MKFLRFTLRCACAAALLTACGGEPDETTTSATGTAADTSTGADATTAEPTGSTGAPGSTGDATTGADTTGADTTSTTDATTGGGAADCELDPDLPFTRDGLVFQLQSEDGATCVWLKRRDDSEPDVIYKAVPYTLLEFKAGHAGQVAHVTDLGELTWESTHHNWTDVATAEADGVRYRLEDWYTSAEGGEEFSNKWALFARDAATDAVLWGPVLLYPYPM